MATKIQGINIDTYIEVFEELKKAQRVFPPFNSEHEGFAILKEEVDELWDVVKLKPSDPTRKASVREEAIQVAAMALRFLNDCCDKKES